MATQLLFKLGFFCAITAFLLMFLAFATPYWYKSWTRVHSPFSNIGLWHVCLAGYIQPKDPNMKSYVGCWWIHSSEFRLVANQIQPPWFRGIQALSIFTLLANLVGGILLLFYLPDMMYKKLYAGRRVAILFAGSVMELIAAFLVFIIALVFAEMANDPTWMPRPWMNYLSWSYGLCVLSGFFSAFAGMFTFIMGLIFRDKERGIIGSDTLDTRLERMKQKELEAQNRTMNGPPPSYSGAEPVGQGYRDPSMGYPSSGYPSTGYPSMGYRDQSVMGPPSVGGYRDHSVGGPPSVGGYRDQQKEYDSGSMASSYRDEKPRPYPEVHQRMAHGQPRGAHYRHGPPKIDQGYQGRTGSDSSNMGSRGKVDESVV
ncbi:uncharacterized protein LOC124291040 [Haliotis rubra]|uniref:uncharacterized protein LOC124291040 n=1 Tax=Haliotis rubra TaxID=36100 RepID=UPI001EE5C4FA|nr:uncharacterized protein LOC124291040 [Haliotis rubra]